jgi:hypothetical protein
MRGWEAGAGDRHTLLVLQTFHRLHLLISSLQVKTPLKRKLEFLGLVHRVGCRMPNSEILVGNLTLRLAKVSINNALALVKNSERQVSPTLDTKVRNERTNTLPPKIICKKMFRAATAMCRLGLSEISCVSFGAFVLWHNSQRKNSNDRGTNYKGNGCAIVSDHISPISFLFTSFSLQDGSSLWSNKQWPLCN